MRVLIVDDEPKVRQHLRMLLNTRNVYEIAGEACDGAEALKMMDAAAPDIVITDIRMPRMNGHIAKPLDVNVLAKILKKWIP